MNLFFSPAPHVFVIVTLTVWEFLFKFWKAKTIFSKESKIMFAFLACAGSKSGKSSASNQYPWVMKLKSTTLLTCKGIHRFTVVGFLNKELLHISEKLKKYEKNLFIRKFLFSTTASKKSSNYVFPLSISIWKNQKSLVLSFRKWKNKTI